MSTNRRTRPRADEGQAEIVNKLREKGYSVETNMNDILIGVDGLNIWIELKNPLTTLRKDGRVKPEIFKKSQIELLRSWKGQYNVAWTLEGCERIIDRHLSSWMEVPF